MKEKVHVHSWPIDRDFTFKEWCDYLNDRDHRGESASEVVAEFGGWKFNVHGVCLNRRCVLQKFIGRTGGQFSVEVYQAPKGRKIGEPLMWNYTTSYSDGIVGGGGGYAEIDGDEDEAIIKGLEDIIKRYERSIERYTSSGIDERYYHERKSVCRSAIAAAREEIEKRKQLTLF